MAIGRWEGVLLHRVTHPTVRPGPGRPTQPSGPSIGLSVPYAYVQRTGQRTFVRTSHAHRCPYIHVLYKRTLTANEIEYRKNRNLFTYRYLVTLVLTLTVKESILIDQIASSRACRAVRAVRTRACLALFTARQFGFAIFQLRCERSISISMNFIYILSTVRYRSRRATRFRCSADRARVRACV